MNINRICIKCGEIFPWRIKINDVWKNTSKNRSYCYKCKPFGKKGRTLPEGQVSKRMKNYHNWPEEWKKEHRLKTKARAKGRKEELVRLKGGKCEHCGYDKCLRALSFHHRNPEEKKYALDMSNSIKIPWKEVLTEVEKCDLLCMNCHAEIHDQA